MAERREHRLRQSTRPGATAHGIVGRAQRDGPRLELHRGRMIPVLDGDTGAVVLGLAVVLLGHADVRKRDAGFRGPAKVRVGLGNGQHECH